MESCRRSPASPRRRCVFRRGHIASKQLSLRIRCLASHSDDAQSASVSIETPVIHDLRIKATHRFSNQKRTQLQR
ncbi:hypothetical protein CIT26_22075 [Mesorhizobium temperatum]|uniref:Uncharacterized protein n=1 Tax=Mesorhizobium temperatum TaxID=241416 RepID=A0A271LIG5_9HYPH|nr:hypothetical protein CIT26_22075 [Mesorhizobium temperatum]